jgi:hypothetical protein
MALIFTAMAEGSLQKQPRGLRMQMETRVTRNQSAGTRQEMIGRRSAFGPRCVRRPRLATDDGKNFLRIQHPAPFQVHFWEVGNQVFQNGYYGGEGLEEDAHAPYPEKSADNERSRKKNLSLSPAAYAKNFLEFAHAMKAVDPKIHLGLPLNPSVNDKINRQEWTKDTITGSTSM